MSTRVTPGGSKPNRVKEVLHDALHKIRRIRTVFAFWSRDPRSRRSSNSPTGPITPSAWPVAPAGSTTIDTANQAINTPEKSHGPHVHSGVDPFAEPSAPNTPSANALTFPSPISNGSGVTTASPGPPRPAAWARLEAALTTLEKSARAIPPLHSLARAVLDCLDTFEAAAPNDKMYDRLAGELNAMITTLNHYATELGSEPASKSVTQMTDSIRDCATHINQQRERGGRRQMFELARDREELANSCHQIESLSRELQILANDEILRRTSQILHKTKKKSEDDWLRELGHVDEARYNSDFAIQMRRHECTPGTHTGVQDTIKAWVNNPTGLKVLWVNGMPGMGKTTISYSLCKWLQDNHLLGASYFCSRAPSVCASLRRLIPTIAHQLASSLPAFRSSLFKVLEELPDSCFLEPHLQYERLLLRPLQETKGQVSTDMVIVIDGLDQCEDDYSIRKILEQLLDLPQKLPIRICVTSRPERMIYNLMSAAGYASTAIYLHNIDVSIVKADIKKYITKSLESISPTHEQIELLTNLSENLFIYAATIVEYILPHHTGGDPITRLQTVLMHSNNGPEAMPFEVHESLYSLYSTVLEQVLKKNPSQKELEDLQLVLWTVVCAKESMTVKALAELIGIGEDRIKSSLGSLHSVLRIPEIDGYVMALHASFSDFIRNPPRPTVFHCKEVLHSHFLAQRCFEVMRLKLKFNICGLETSFVADGDVPELEGRINNNIPVQLFYACRHWSYHLQQIALLELNQVDATPLITMLSEFLSRRLLFWMEVLSLRGCIEVGAEMLFSTRLWLLGNNSWLSVQQTLIDASNFVTRFASNSCSNSTPHIYISALPSCPRSSTVHGNYWPLTRRLLNITGLAMNRTQDAALSRWLVGAPVSSLSCSLDGAKIASGSYDGTIRWWNIYTGTMIGQPVQGHSGPVCSNEFSRDGARLASGSFDRTIVLYDTTTATPRIIQQLTGHEGAVLALGFSSDATRIASGSSDGSVRLWVVETGELISETLGGELEFRSITFSSDDSRIIAMGARTPVLEGTQEFDAIIQSWDISTPGHPSTIRVLSGHEGFVLSMDLSPDAAYMATAGRDHTIRLWQADTGIPINEPFRGHTSEVLVVKFSPDGTRLISGSADRTVRIWDVSTGSPIGQPFEGHSGEVGAISVAPGGNWVVSGSNDSSIRLWDADTVLPTRPLIGAHSASVCSVTFSASSDLIFSGSDDKSVRVWNVATGTLMDTLTVKEGGSVLSVACSPDNRRYAAAARNGTFIVGEIRPGPQLGEPIIGVGHQDAVLSVAFSDDGTRLVTSSYDRTIRTWDPRTLEAIGQPFSEHERTVTEVALARRGNDHLVVSASGDKTVRLYDLSTAAVVAPPLSGHESTVLSIASSPNGDCIISGSYDKTIRVWDGYTGNMIIPPIIGHMGPVRSVALFQSPDGTRIIASGSDDKTVRLWEVNTGAPLGPPLEGHEGSVLSVSFSPNGKYVASGSANGEIRLWDIKSKWAPLINGGSRLDGGAHPSRNGYANGTNSWVFEANGWVTDRGRLLFWVPQAHHPHLEHFFKRSSHPCSLIVSNGLSYGVESWDLAIGDEWQTCFNVDYSLR